MSYREEHRNLLLKRGKYVPIANEIFSLGLKHTAIAIYVYLLKNEVDFHPNHRQIAEAIRCDETTVQGAITALEEKNVIKVHGRGNRGGKHRYQIYPPSVWLMPTTPKNPVEPLGISGCIKEEKRKENITPLVVSDSASEGESKIVAESPEQRIQRIIQEAREESQMPHNIALFGSEENAFAEMLEDELGEEEAQRILTKKGKEKENAAS